MNAIAASRDHFIDQQWIDGAGAPFTSTNPATGEKIWRGRAAVPVEIDRAVEAARRAFESGWPDLPIEQRSAFLERFAEALRAHQSELAEIISLETGKPLWEASEEVTAMIGKVALSIRAHGERRRETHVDLPSTGGPKVVASTRFKPHGVVAVFGPFNFPGHLPNGHIVPALLAGNTIVFKPSEHTPAVARKTVELWQAAGLPKGVLNLIQGGRETGIALGNHPRIDGLFFTGSAAAGLSLHRAFAPHVGKILALELGGNNPLIAWDAKDTQAVTYNIIQSAYLTSGQRCTCARRLIVPDDFRGQEIVDRALAALPKIRVGPFTDSPEPFMGPVISSVAADQILAAQEKLCRLGGQILIPVRRRSPDSAAMLWPGLIDMTGVVNRPDEEIFGPLLQVIRVPDFDAAIAEAGATRYGLSAGLLSDDAALYQLFLSRIRAGIVNWNRPTTGASGSLAFGGAGESGNHRPSGYYAADYCSYPVASMETETLAMTGKISKGLEEAF